MRRQIQDHRIDESDSIRVEAGEAPGSYRIAGFDGASTVSLQFQQGNADEVGTNGVTAAQLLAVVADQLRSSAGAAPAAPAAPAGADAGAAQQAQQPDKASSSALKHVEAALRELTDDARGKAQERAQTRATQRASAEARAAAGDARQGQRRAGAAATQSPEGTGTPVPGVKSANPPAATA